MVLRGSTLERLQAEAHSCESFDRFFCIIGCKNTTKEEEPDVNIGDTKDKDRKGSQKEASDCYKERSKGKARTDPALSSISHPPPVFSPIPSLKLSGTKPSRPFVSVVNVLSSDEDVPNKHIRSNTTKTGHLCLTANLSKPSLLHHC